ncbi:hypothetical protein K2Q16_04405 [Patescibacteria group bacterium]|nr:hypothetical protein [Patescibacteria group bacterium]
MTSKEKYNKIYRFTRLRGRTPSYDEVCQIFDYKSKSSAHYLIKKLIREGYLKKSDNGSIQLLEWSDISIPFLGMMHAGKTVGFPSPSEEETAEVMTLSELLMVDLHSAKLFKVQGDSMIEAGIFENDILLVESTDKWSVGDIVIAEIDGEETLKYIFKDKDGRPYLKPANCDMKIMKPEEYLKVKAVVKNVIKSYGR